MHHRIHHHDEWEDEPTNPFEQLLTARILLAEDDPALRTMMAARLRQDGCDVVEARSGDEALEMIATIADGEAPMEGVDLVIMDVRMPGLSGLEVIRLLRSWKWSTPVLFVTAYPDPELAAEVGELDARLLAKPFGLSRLSNAALEAIRENKPDVVVLDWEMPLLNGPELVRIVRSPGVFPTPDVPIIMLTGHLERWRVLEAAKLGVNEFLCKPVSAKSLHDRLISILLKPREIVRVGNYYGPAPRNAAMPVSAAEAFVAEAAG